MGYDNKNTTLVKHAAAVHISSVLTLNQRKIANILLKNAYSELKSGRWHSIQVRDLLNQLGWKNTSNTTEMIKNDLRILNTIQLEWNVLNRDRKKIWNITTFLSDAKIENGNISYSYSLALGEALYGPNIYAKLDLLVQKLFKTKHSIVLWEYILCELSAAGKSKIFTKWTSLDELRKIFALHKSKTYFSFNALNQKVLIPSINEINGKSGIEIYMETRREGRRIELIRFRVEKVETSEKKENIAGGIAGAFGISDEQIKMDIETYGEDRVNFALEYTKKQIDTGKIIGNIAAFYKVALRENWLEKVASSTVKKRELDDFISNMRGPTFFVNIMASIKNRVGEGAFSSWFLDMTFVSANEKHITLKTTSKFKMDYILRNFLDIIQRAVREEIGNRSVSIMSR
jgi:hypothetical protein